MILCSSLSIITPGTWPEKYESLERMNSIREANEGFYSCYWCKRLGTSRLHKCHDCATCVTLFTRVSRYQQTPRSSRGTRAARAMFYHTLKVCRSEKAARRNWQWSSNVWKTRTMRWQLTTDSKWGRNKGRNKRLWNYLKNIAQAVKCHDK